MEDESDNETKGIDYDKFFDVEDESSEVISDSEADSIAVMLQNRRRNPRQIIHDSESSASESEIDTRNIGWTKYDPKRNLEVFIGDPGVKVFPTNFQSISEVAGLFIGDDLLELIVNETNRYYIQTHHEHKSQKKSKKWADVTVPELKKFLALNIVMGQVQKTNINDYWSTNPLIATPFFSKIMSRYKYQMILWFLHFSNNTETAQNPNRLWKIEPVVNYFLNKFNTVYKPEQELFLGEAVIPYRGQLSFQVYNPNKITKYGILSRLLCEANTGYIYNFKLYCGKSSNLKNTIPTVLNKSEYLWHHIYMDNYYNSVALAEQLLEKNIRICGTVRKNRGFPKELNSVKLRKNESDFRRKSEVLVLKWKNKKEIRMVSTIHNANIVETNKISKKTGETIRKPECIVKYNQHMKGVDLDRYLPYYSFLQKSIMWTKKTFTFLVHCALLNSFIVYRKLNPNTDVTFSKYLQTLAMEWISCDIEIDDSGQLPTSSLTERTSCHDPPHRLAGDIKTHHLEKIRRSGITKYPQKRCRVCKKHGKRTDTSFICKSCRIPLCKGHCFEIYHTSKKY